MCKKNSFSISISQTSKHEKMHLNEKNIDDDLIFSLTLSLKTLNI